MALIECEECGDELSDKADSCPNCGAPVRSDREKFWEDTVGVGGCLGIFIVAGLTVFFIVAWGISESKNNVNSQNNSVKLDGTGLSVSDYKEFMNENGFAIYHKGEIPKSSSSYPAGTVSRFYESGKKSPFDDVKLELHGPSNDLYQVKLRSLYFTDKNEAIEKLMLIEKVAKIYFKSKRGEIEKDAVVDVNKLNNASWQTISSQLRDFDKGIEDEGNFVKVSVFKPEDSPRFSAKISIATKELAEFRKTKNKGKKGSSSEKTKDKNTNTDSSDSENSGSYKVNKTMARTMCQKFVKKRLVSPSSADFPWSAKNIYVHEDSRSYTVLSHVNSKNKFGTSLRIDWSCKVKELKEKWELLDLNLDER